MPRRRPNPLAWIAIGVVLLLLVLLVRAVGGRDSYAPAALRVAGSTAKLGAEASALRAKLQEIDRLALFRNLRAWQRRAEGDLEEGKKLEPSVDAAAANGYLVASLGMRAKALAAMNPAVRNALSDRDLQVAVSQLVNVMRDLSFSDRSYELFVESWPSKGAKPPPSRWIADPQDATIDGVTNFVRELRKQEKLAADYNLTVASVSLGPKPTGKENDIDQVPFTKSLSVTVVVQNTGNQRIAATTVEAILTSETNPEPQAAEGQLGSMAPNDKRSVTLKGLAPTSGGPINLLRVTVGPVGLERNIIDNTVEVKFSMKKP